MVSCKERFPVNIDFRNGKPIINQGFVLPVIFQARYLFYQLFQVRAFGNPVGIGIDDGSVAHQFHLLYGSRDHHFGQFKTFCQDNVSDMDFRLACI